MDAVEYLRDRARMCAAISCQDCEHWDGYPESNCLDELCKNPARAVEIVRRWAQENPEEPQLALSAMEQRFVHSTSRSASCGRPGTRTGACGCISGARRGTASDL